MSYSLDYTDFAFGDSAWEKVLSSLKVGDTLSAAHLLAALEGENEDALEDAFQHLEDLSVTLDISDLPRGDSGGELAVRLRREEQLVKQGTLLQSLEETDPLRLYLEELAGLPVCGDLSVLAEELEQANREEAEKPELWTAIVNLSLSRVAELACEHTGRGVLLLDLMQEGSMGLWQSLPCYCGGDFAAFRDWRIRQAMAKAITVQARNNGVGQKMRQALEDYRAVDEKLLTELGRNPTLEEIARELHMTVQETSTVADMLENARSLNRARVETEPKPREPDDEQAVEDTAYFQMRQRISELLSVLDERDARVLTLRFGLEGGLPLSPEDTGKKMGMTAEEVVAAEGAALGKLRSEG